MVAIGNFLIQTFSKISNWLSSNFLGGLYMFYIVLAVFGVFFNIGRKKES